MALDAAQPFVWGPGGGRMTPDEIAAQRKVADALIAQGSNYSPVQSWTQGAARVAQALLGGLESRQADEASRANQASDAALLTSLFGGGASAAPSTAPATSAPASSPSITTAPPAARAPSTVGKIYSNDEPSPLDPPSGDDRKAMIATILGEAGNQGPVGENAVASVIRNRAVNGGYGGNTPAQVVTAPNQFEPWNTAAGRSRMAAAAADPAQAAAADAAISRAYGEGGQAPNDPTNGATMFFSPKAQAALGRPVPAWAQGPGQDIGDHRFFGGAPGAPVQVAQNGPDSELPVNAQPTQGTLPTAQAVAAASQPTPAPAAPASSAVNPRLLAAMSSPYVSDGTKKILGLVLAQQMATAKQNADPLRALQIREAQQKLAPVGEPYHDTDGNLVQKDATGKITVLSPANKPPTSVSEYKYYTDNFQPTPQQPQPMDYATFSTAKARAGATTVNNSIDTGAAPAYDKQLVEGLGKSHAALANGVEDAQTRARDIAAMQGAIDAIQKNGGTTGGLAPAQRLELQKSINAGAAALGITKPFSEADISDKEFLQKFNRSMAGAQAKGAVGSRVTNFEMGNFMKANPGIDMTITGNQRLLGIQAQIEQRNIAVGNAIRDATAQAISAGKKIDPVTVQKIITDYDQQHHIQDPVTGQDLTQSYALPEFQNSPTNASMANAHTENLKAIEKTIGGITYVQRNGQWYPKQ